MAIRQKQRPFSYSRAETKKLKDPDSPIFRERKWHYSFPLSNGTFTELESPDLSTEWHDLRRSIIMPLIAEHFGDLDRKHCLDIACNAGFWTMELAKRGAVVEAFDILPGVIPKAAAICAHNDLDARFTESSLFEYQPSRKGFDLILCLGLMYHLTDPFGALRLIRSWCDGMVVFDTSISDLSGPVLEIGSHDKYVSCSTTEFSFVPTVEAFEAMLKKAGFGRFQRVIREEGAYSEGTIRALWLAWGT